MTPSTAPVRLIDVSHTVEHGMVTYKGLPAPLICDYLSRQRTDAYFEDHPHLTGELAEWLARSGAVLVGIDSFNIDDTNDGARPVHSVLLGHDIPIVEHLRGLGAVPERGGRFFGVPVKVRGFGTFPVRAFVIA